MRILFAVLVGMLWLASCSSDSSDKTADAVPDLAVEESRGTDLVQEIAQEVADDVVAEVTPDIAPEVVEEFPPRGLPFEFKRTDKGDPVPGEETTAFTKKVTAVWEKAGWARWLLRTSTGVDPSTGKEDYLAWYNDVQAVKEGDTVTFRQTGGDHNMWISGSKILTQAMGGCSLTGDWEMCKLAQQYCKGLTASVKGFVWDENDPAKFLMARAVFPMDQEFTLDEQTWQDDGRKKNVVFSTMYKEEHGWNAHTFEWPHNPTWGYMYVTNMRSKDDVCAITRTTTFLAYMVADAPYDWVADACQETLETMQGFNKDIVDFDYNIRTKGQDGAAYIDTEQDLGSYNWYTALDPLNECTARLATDLIAYGEPLTNDCETGFGSVYEDIAVSGHYYNYPIVWGYHMAALGHALMYRHVDIAWNLLYGMTLRMDDYLDPSTDQPGASNGHWNRDMAVLLVQAASVGLPLTSKEVRLVQKHFTQAVTGWETFANWDLWSPDVPDGEYSAGSGFRPPSTDEGIHRDSIAIFLEYCNSPFKNPDGRQFVDCDVVADMTNWGN